MAVSWWWSGESEGPKPLVQNANIFDLIFLSSIFHILVGIFFVSWTALYMVSDDSDDTTSYSSKLGADASSYEGTYDISKNYEPDSGSSGNSTIAEDNLMRDFQHGIDFIFLVAFSLCIFIGHTGIQLVATYDEKDTRIKLELLADGAMSGANSGSNLLEVEDRQPMSQQKYVVPAGNYDNSDFFYHNRNYADSGDPDQSSPSSVDKKQGDKKTAHSKPKLLPQHLRGTAGGYSSGLSFFDDLESDSNVERSDNGEKNDNSGQPVCQAKELSDVCEEAPKCKATMEVSEADLIDLDANSTSLSRRSVTGSRQKVGVEVNNEEGVAVGNIDLETRNAEQTARNTGGHMGESVSASVGLEGTHQAMFSEAKQRSVLAETTLAEANHSVRTEGAHRSIAKTRKDDFEKDDFRQVSPSNSNTGSQKGKRSNILAKRSPFDEKKRVDLNRGPLTAGHLRASPDSYGRRLAKKRAAKRESAKKNLCLGLCDPVTVYKPLLFFTHCLLVLAYIVAAIVCGTEDDVSNDVENEKALHGRSLLICVLAALFWTMWAYLAIHLARSMKYVVNLLETHGLMDDDFALYDGAHFDAGLNVGANFDGGNLLKDSYTVPTQRFSVNDTRSVPVGSRFQGGFLSNNSLTRPRARDIRGENGRGTLGNGYSNYSAYGGDVVAM